MAKTAAKKIDDVQAEDVGTTENMDTNSPQEQANAPAEAHSTVSTDAADILVAPPVDDSEDKENEEKETASEAQRQESPTLESISVLSHRYRVPSWQVAALLRMMGWESDRLVTDGEFTDGLKMLGSRRIGGGRM